MATFALIKGGKVINTIIAEEEFLPQIKDQYEHYVDITVMNGVGIGHEHDGEKFIAPEPVEVKTMSLFVFKSLLTQAERIGIKKSTNVLVEDSWEMLTENPSGIIDKNDQNFLDFLNLLVADNIITSERMKEILA